MKQFAELIPVVLFFVVYQLDGRTLTLEQAVAIALTSTPKTAA